MYVRVKTFFEPEGVTGPSGKKISRWVWDTQGPIGSLTITE